MTDPTHPDPVAVIPAAGLGTRLGRLPCSKEVLPIPTGGADPDAETSLSPACLPLLESLAAAGVRRAFVVLRDGKWDVPATLGSRTPDGLRLAYLPIEASGSVPETLDHARPFVRESVVALGFPDVHFHPSDAFTRLLERHRRTGADLVLGLFPARRPRSTDMVELDAPAGSTGESAGPVRRIVVRPEATRLRYNWLIAVWGPTLTEHLHAEVERAGRGEAGAGPAQESAEEPTGKLGELQLGACFQRAIERGLSVEGVPFPDGGYRDLGTPGELAAALRGQPLPRGFDD